MPRDELFGRFYAALDKINFFSTSSVGIEDPAQIAKATQLFDEAFPVWLLLLFLIILHVDITHKKDSSHHSFHINLDCDWNGMSNPE